MKNKYLFVTGMLLVILVVSMGFTSLYVSRKDQTAEEEFVVVTSFYPMYIATMNVVGDMEGVTLKNLSEPQTGCLHDFQLTPADMKLLSTADVFVINGGGMESFMEEIAAQYPELVIITACEGLQLLEGEGHSHEEDSVNEEEHAHDETCDGDHEEDHVHDHGTINGHAWMSVSLYREQVAAIAEGLAEAAPEYSEEFLANKEAYDRELEMLQRQQEELMSLLAGEEVILFHCAFSYVAADLGLSVASCMDLDEERQVSAGEVAEVIEVIEHHQVGYIFAEELYGAKMCQMIQNEIEVEVVYLDPLNRGSYDADSYLTNMRNNLNRIMQVLE